MPGIYGPHLKTGYRHHAVKSTSIVLSRLLFLAAVLLILNGCSFGSRPPNSNTDERASPKATVEQNSLPFGISTPTAKPDNQTEFPASLETYLYTHPDDLFSLQAPEGWDVNHSSYDAEFVDPQSGTQLIVGVVNTGYSLDSESFTRLVESRETSNARKYDRFIVIDRQDGSPDFSRIIVKSFIDLGSIKNGAAFYQCKNNSVLIVDFWTDEEKFTTYQDLFEVVYESVNLNEEVITEMAVYSFDQAVLQSNGYFSILVPPYWDYRRTEREYTIIETFTAPDEKAVIQTLVYDDGKSMTMNVAGDLTLALLRNNYTYQIKIDNDEFLKDGRELLTWHSLDGSYQGLTTFITRETAVYILTVMWGSDPDLYYQTVLESVLMSYTPDKVSE